MAKKRKIKKGVLIFIAIFLFFMVYFISFNLGRSMETKDQSALKNIQKDKEDTRTLTQRLNSSDKIYVSDDKVESIKIEEGYWEDIKYFINKFSKIRETSNFEPIYTGYSDEGIRFSTNLNVLRIYTVNEEEYYKIPIQEKEEFKKLLDSSIYTSFDFVKQYKTWESVSITNGEKNKKLLKWKYDDLSYKLVSKRIVGKVQPENSKERSEYNFTINIKGDSYEFSIETMGKDYVKISSEKGEAYYEVPTVLFDYIKNEIFKIS